MILLASYQVSMSSAIVAYAVYGVIAIGLIAYLARTLHHNGTVFLADVFESDALAGAVNHLLVVGFVLLNLGYAIINYRVRADYVSDLEFINGLVNRLGVLVLVLGVVHLTNMLVFWRIRSHNTTITYFQAAGSAYQPPPPTGGPAPTASN